MMRRRVFKLAAALMLTAAIFATRGATRCVAGAMAAPASFRSTC